MKVTIDRIHGEMMHSHALEDIEGFELKDEWYGISWQEGSTAPAFTRIGNMALHNAITGLPVQQLMKRCLVTAAGAVTYLYGSDSTRLADGSPADLSGASGNVMVEIPEHYYKAWKNGDWNNYVVSMYPLSGFAKIAKHYISAYEASLNRSTLKAASVVNTTTTYRGGNNTAAWDATSQSLLGKPVTSLTKAQERAAAELIGTGWCEEPFQYWSHWRWLAYIEYATRDLQQPINNTLTSEGYRQGGLGAGVTDAIGTEWNTFNSYNPFIPCGITNSLGNQSGEVSYTAIDFKGTGVNQLFKVPSYRGIENPFGHIWKRIEGVNIYKTGSVIKCYVKNGVTGFVDGTASGYNEVANMPATSNYILDVMGDGNLFPKSVQTTTPAGNKAWCDYYYAPSSDGGWTAPLSGAAAHNGSSAGFASVNAIISAASAFASFGFRLCFVP